MDYFNQKSKRLVYRKLQESDVESWTEFFIDNPNLLYLGIPKGLARDQMAEEWIKTQFQRYQESGFGGLAATDKENDELIGITGLLKRDINGNIEYEVAYSLKPKYWRQGFGSEMSATMKQFAVDNRIHHRVISVIHKDNIGSIKIAQKNGMGYLFDTEYKGIACIVYGVEL